MSKASLPGGGEASAATGLSDDGAGFPARAVFPRDLGSDTAQLLYRAGRASTST
jgi:hypothetical protein